MTAAVIYVSNPFRPDLNRRVVALRRRRRIRALAPRSRAPFICLVNGKPALRATWNRRVKDGDVVSFVTLPQGGGGKSNPLSIVLMLALSVVTAGAATAAWGMAAAGQIGATFGVLGADLFAAAVGAAVYTAGSALVNALVPPPKPPAAQQAAAIAAPSPTYSLNAQGNLARLGQPIPALYGRHIIFPDYAAMPYTEFAGQEQYLFQLLAIGQGYYDVETIRLEDTTLQSNPIADGAVHEADGSFPDIDYQIVPPGGTVTLFPANVTQSIEVSGQEIPQADVSLAFTGSVTFNATNKTLTAGSGTPFANARAGDSIAVTGTTNNNGTLKVASKTSNTVVVVENVIVNETAASTTLAPAWVGPFTLNAPGTLANYIGFDLVTPRGLYLVNTETGALTALTFTVAFQYRAIDDNGTPTGSWTQFATPSYSAGTTTPQRWSEKTAVPSGRYQVRVVRTDAKNTSAQAGHEVAWGGMRAYLPGSQTYGNMTLLALRMRASNSLSTQASRKINVIATRKLPVWDGSTWSAPTATRNPAWALADICRNTDYGAGLGDQRIDLPGLLDLAAVWESRGDYFDGIFDSQSTVWEALQQVAKVGRAVPFQQGGIVRIVRDSAQTIPSGMFSVRNIARGSFKLDYSMPSEETSDAVDVEYFDENTWQMKTVRAALVGSAEANVSQLRLFGVTSRAQAWREGMYMMAANRYRRRHITFKTEMEGFIPVLGDLVAIQHDLPTWGQGGEVVAVSGTTVTLSETPDWEEGGATHYIAFRDRDGSVLGPYVATPGDAENQVVIEAFDDPIFYVGGDAERTHFAFGPGSAQYVLARVVSTKPRSEYNVEISVAVESDYVHTADTGAAPTASAWQLPTRVTVPVISGLLVRSDPAAADLMFLSWTPAPTADHYLIEVSESGNGWTRIGEPRTANFTAVASYGARTMIRVCAVGLTQGPWVEVSYGSSASYMWSGTDSTLMWAVDANSLMWRY